jgi:predicted nucleic acid-binding protein
MMPMTGADRKTYEMYCLDASKVGMWLATIETKRVKDVQARAAIGELQVKASEVINQWLRSEQAPPAAAPRFAGGDSPTELLIANMQHALQLAQRFQRLESEQEQVSQRLALVENKQRLAAAEIEPVSPAQPELPAISKRRLIVEHVNRFAAAMNMGQHEVWRLLYHHVNRRLSISVYSYKLGPKETKLDRLESLGLLDKVGKVCDTDLQIPVERQRWLAAPISQAVQ